MRDLSPIGYVLGLLIVALGVMMLIPAGFQFLFAPGGWQPFLLATGMTIALGLFLVIACLHRKPEHFTVRQSVLLVVLVWLVIPGLGSLPLVFSAQPLSVTDAVFESMSGFTTTGSTVLSGLEEMDRGILLWRGLLQWIGGIAVVVLAVAFLPRFGVGGMQLFRTTMSQQSGDRLIQLRSIFVGTCSIYIVLTASCALTYVQFGMSPFEAAVHAMTTIATGGFATRDDSFAGYSAAIEYSAVLFMLLASFPFLCYMQLMNRRIRPLLTDSQIRGFLAVAFTIVVALVLWRTATAEVTSIETVIRKALFNGVSILTGTGYVSADYDQWGGFALAVFFLIGLIGGCAGSTTCSVKIFRYQVLASALFSQFRRIEGPHRVSVPLYQGRPIDPEIIASVIGFLFLFVTALVVFTILLSLTGLNLETAASGAATALANVGPGLGEVIGPTKNFASLNDPAKWLLTAAMLFGRLELLTVLVLFQLSFWRD